jgi:protoporphyrinogen oxidase
MFAATGVGEDAAHRDHVRKEPTVPMTTMPEANRRIVVLGAGITGLTAAWELSRSFPGRVVLLEKAAAVGGLAATSSTEDGFTFDIGSHRLHRDNHPAVNQLIADLCGPDLLKRERRGQIFIHDRPFRYPPSALDIMTAFGLKDFVRFGLGYLRARLGRLTQGGEPDNFEDYTTSAVGRGLYERFYKPYALKLYGMSPRDISKDAAVSRVRKFAATAIAQDLKKRFTGTARRTYLYPSRGIGQLATTLQQRFVDNGGEILFISRLDALRIRDDNEIDVVAFHTRDGAPRELATDTFVSTISIDALHHLIRLESDQGRTPDFDLKWRGLRLLYLVTSEKVQSENETFYFPELHVPFGRVSEISKYSPSLSPDPNRTLLTIEIPCSPGDETWTMADERLADVCTAGLHKLGIVHSPTRGDATMFSRKIEKVYPVYDLGWQDRFERIYQRLNSIDNLYMVGRGALFLHCNIDHCMLMAIKLSRHLADGSGGKEAWEAIRKGFFDYRVRE